jgi:hypothetical protein
MEAILGISLYSCPYLKLAKRYVFLIIAYVFFSTKLEKRPEQVLPGSVGWGGQVESGTGRQGVEMAQTIYVHMNK